jgi:ornithine cyclodeaminase/alanine dehydrogenase-like protein (mu-crystallin family)
MEPRLQVFDAETTAKLLPIADCIEAMEKAVLAIGAGTATTPPRAFIPTGLEGGHLGVMPCLSTQEKVAVTKVLTLLPENARRDLPTIRGFASLTDIETGEVLAIMDGMTLTAVRTAAASGLATRLLAREDADSCGIFGTGTQASSHLRAMVAVRPVQEVVVWGRSFEKAQRFAQRESGATGITVRACADPQEAAACDIVCTVTASPTPVLFGDWVADGAHINLVGAHSAGHREADSELVARAAVYVDSMESLEHEGGDLLIPLNEGRISPAHIRGELGAVLKGEVAGRRSSDEITLYNSVGVATQDLYAALRAYQNWQAGQNSQELPEG